MSVESDQLFDDCRFAFHACRQTMPSSLDICVAPELVVDRHRRIREMHT